MPSLFVWTLDDFGAPNLGSLINGTFVISGSPDVARFSDDDANFDDFFGNGGQTQDPGLNQLLTEDLVLDGNTVATTGDGIYNAAEGQIVNNTTGETGRIIYITINGGRTGDFIGVATTIPINAGDSVTTSALTPFATEPFTNIIACFTPGARLRAQAGDVPVEQLRVGDLVMTKDRGLQPIRWIGRRFVNAGKLASSPELSPVRISQDSLGAGLPKHDIVVSPQHRMLIDGPSVELYYGLSEALIPAAALVGRPGITIEKPELGTEYIHLLFDRHEVLFCEGAETESFHPYALSRSDPDEDPVVEELFALFPDLRDNPKSYGGTARPCLRMKEARLICAFGATDDTATEEAISDIERASHKCVA